MAIADVASDVRPCGTADSGGLLSDSAIVAREHRIPGAVETLDATQPAER